MSSRQQRRSINRVMGWIETHLDEALDIEAMAALACYSQFHFHRLFRAHAGEGIYAYRKRLLLERAARQLRYGNDSIGEVAFRSGYDNQASFNKAFKARFVLTPGRMRRLGKPLRLMFGEQPSGKIQVQAEFRVIDEIHLICRRESGSYAEAAPRAWAYLMQFAYARQPVNRSMRMIGIVYDDPSTTDPEHIRYEACIDIEADTGRDAELIRQTLPVGEYAVFLHSGAYQYLSDTYAAIYHDWLPESGCTLRDAPGFELYLNRDPRRTKAANLRTEIHIPVIRKG